MPSAIALNQNKIVARAGTFFARKCHVNPDLIVLKQLNVGDRLMRVMGQNLRDLLEVGLWHVRMWSGQTTLIQDLAAGAC